MKYLELRLFLIFEEVCFIQNRIVDIETFDLWSLEHCYKAIIVTTNKMNISMIVIVIFIWIIGIPLHVRK